MSPNQTKAVEKSSVSGCLVRLFWVFAGNAILLLTAASIARERGWEVGWADLVFGLTLAFLVAARFVDARYFEPKEKGGGPVSLAEWRRYAAWLLLGGLLLWAAAHALALWRGQP